MDNQDKLFKQFQEASHKAESKDFAAMDKVWSRVEDKLDKKEDRKTIVLWKKLAVAASLLLFFTLGYQLTQSGDVPVAPKTVPQNEVVTGQPESKKEISTDPLINNTPSKEAEKSRVQQRTPKPSVIVSSPKNKEDIIREDAVQIVNSTITGKSEIVATDTTTQSLAKMNIPTANNIINTEIAVNDKQEQTVGDSKILITTSINPVTGEKTITGVVYDTMSIPLPGATITIKGTPISSTTDLDGKFSIKAKKGDQLEFTYVGFKSQRLKVDNKTNLAIAMQEDSSELNEVAVVGYGSTTKSSKRKDKGQQMANYKVPAPSNNIPQGYYATRQNNIIAKQSLNQPLQGRVAGLEISNANAAANTPSIQIRGVSSIKKGNEPLYVVDGVPVNAATFASLDPTNIKEISVLKDHEASSIYGSRGANGVVIITLNKKLSKKEIRKLQKEQQQLIQQPKFAPITQEDYDSFMENPFETPKNAPLSTFSIDVDNASYTNVRRFINNGQAVPKDAVRIEEMVNFFKYQYPQPIDNNPFSINTEYSACPWNKNHQLLRIGLQGKSIATDNLPASNLVFLIDVSGSMEDQNKLPLLIQSMKVLIEQLRKEDKVAIVVYAGAAGMVLPPTKGSDKQTIISALEKLTAGGSTAGGEGIELAYKTAQENFIKGGNNRVILATDGDFNVGGSSNTDMQALIEQKRKSGIFLTCLGFGMGNYKDSKMEILSDKGNGNYAYIDNIQEANRFLGKEFKGSMFAIAKDVKIQIEFNPKHVRAYRLLGYENRKLRAEDFTNDAIDAGELGSGHTVTALYEIIPAGVNSEFINNQPDLKYTKVEESTTKYNDELATIKFRYKKPDGDKSIEMVRIIENKAVPLQNSTADFKFSAAVAWFGLKLRDSQLVKDKSSAAIKKLAQEGLTNDVDGYKAELIRLIEAVK